MKVLYLIYSKFNSFDEFVIKNRTGFPWVDSLINEVIKRDKVSIGLAVPIRSGTFQKKIQNGLVFYGLPDYNRRNRIRDYKCRLKHRNIETEMNSYTLNAIEDFDPDVVQIFGTENPFGKIINLTNRKVIIHFQGSLQVVLAKWFSAISLFEQFIYSSIKDILLFRGIFHEYYSFRAKCSDERVIMNNCRYIMGRTMFDRRLILLLAPKAKYFFCNEFIRTEFLNTNWNLPLGVTVTCVSVLKGVTYKGLDLLFKISEVLKRYSSTDVIFRICGIREDEEYVKILKRKYRNKTDFKKFIFLGKLDTASLIENLCNSNFFIHPSYVENSSNSICEAMALGMPTIATNVGGTNTLILDGVDGLIVPEGEPFSMAAAIASLIKDYEYAKQIGRNAKLKSLARHDPETNVNELFQIYERVIDRD